MSNRLSNENMVAANGGTSKRGAHFSLVSELLTPTASAILIHASAVISSHHRKLYKGTQQELKE